MSDSASSNRRASTMFSPALRRRSGEASGALPPRFEGGDLLRIAETLEVEQLAAINLFKHGADFFAIEHFASIKPIQTGLE